MYAQLDQKVVKAELLFFWFSGWTQLPFVSTADHTDKLFKNMFPDFKIVINKYRMTTYGMCNWSSCKANYKWPE